MDHNSLISTIQAAEILGCTVKTVHTYIENRHLRNYSPHSRKLLNRQEVEEFRDTVMPTFKRGRPRGSRHETCQHCGQTLRGRFKIQTPEITPREGEAPNR